MVDEVLEGSGADGFPEFWCRLLMRFRRVPVQMADEVPDSGADSRQGSGGFRCRWLMRFWRVPVQMASRSSGADS